MSYREVSEIRDGMQIDWDMPIKMDDGLRAAMRRLPTDPQGPLSRHPQRRPLRQVAALRGRLQDRLEAHGGKAPECHGGLDQQVPELGSLRPREVGAGRLCLRARRFTRLRPVARLCRALVAARDQGPVRLHRVGRQAAVVERQGRLERHLLLRRQPMEGGEHAAEASRRDLRLGGLRRLLSRAEPQRRHLQHLRPELVRHADQDRAVRTGHQGLSQPHERRLGLGPGDAPRRGVGRQPLRSRQDLFRPSHGRRLLQGHVSRLVQDQGADAVGRELGRTAAASARQLRGLLPIGNEAEVARGARHRALDALLHRLRRRPAEAVLRLFPQGREERLEQTAAGAAQRPPSRREVRHSPRGRLADPAHAVDQVPPRERCPKARDGAGDGLGDRDVRRARRRRHLPHRADARRRPRSPVRSLPSSRSRRRPKTPTSSWCCGCSRPT